MLKNRSDLVPIFQTFYKMIQTQFSCTIKVFRSDNAYEYNDKSFLFLLDSNGTLLLTLHFATYILTLIQTKVFTN